MAPCTSDAPWSNTSTAAPGESCRARTRENDYYNVLNAVSGTSANDVWAVGVSHDGTPPSRTLIEHWDGAQWSIVPSPSPDNQLNELRGVAAISATDAWAVGFRSGVQT